MDILLVWLGAAYTVMAFAILIAVRNAAVMPAAVRISSNVYRIEDYRHRIINSFDDDSSCPFR